MGADLATLARSPGLARMPGAGPWIPCSGLAALESGPPPRPAQRRRSSPTPCSAPTRPPRRLPHTALRTPDSAPERTQVDTRRDNGAPGTPVHRAETGPAWRHPRPWRPVQGRERSRRRAGSLAREGPSVIRHTGVRPPRGSSLSLELRAPPHGSPDCSWAPSRDQESACLAGRSAVQAGGFRGGSRWHMNGPGHSPTRTTPAPGTRESSSIRLPGAGPRKPAACMPPETWASRASPRP